MKRFIILVAVLMITAGCSVFPLSPTSTPTMPATPTDLSRILRVGLFCPTSNEEARQSYNTGTEFEEQGKFEEARDAYLHAIELDPGFCDAMDNLGLLLRRQGDLEGAIYWYQRSIEVFPENSVAHQNLAFVYRLQERYEEALAEYQLLREIEPQNPEGYFGAGQVYIYMGRPADAIPLLKVAEDLYASSEEYPVEYLWDTQYMLATAYFLNGEYELCRDYAEPLYPILETDDWINYMLGVSYLDETIYDLEKARFYLLHAQELGMELSPELLKAIGE